MKSLLHLAVLAALLSAAAACFTPSSRPDPTRAPAPATNAPPAR